MFVRTLIGRQAGTIIEMDFVAGTTCIDIGTAMKATEEEIAAAGLEPAPTPLADPEQFPSGYRAEPEEWGGFYVIDAGGVTLNEKPFPNLSAARSFAHDHAAPQAAPELSAEAQALLDNNTRAQLEELAASRNIDISAAKNKGDIVALILAAPPSATVIELKTLSHDELVKLAGERNVDLAGFDKDEDIIAAIDLAAEKAKAEEPKT